MYKKILFIFLASVVLFMTSCGSKTPNYKVRLKNDVDSASYYLGVNYGTNFHHWDFEDVNLNAFARGMLEALKKGSDVDEDLMMEAQVFLSEFSVMLQNRAGEKALKEGLDFLEANKKKQGVFTLPSGLQYRIIREGSGARPNREDMVEIHYQGTLIDETVFDSSKERGMPAQFSVGGLVPGFSEALMLMSEGSIWEVFIPSELGYGPHGSPPRIKPNSVIIFEIEMIKVIRNDDPEE